MKVYRLAVLAMFCLLLPFGAVQAQESPVLDTITVVGSGTALGSPDVANVQIGVETLSPEINEAFAQTNTTIEAVIAAIMEVGVAREDIRTVGLNLYSQPPMVEAEGPLEYRVANQVNVTVRDIAIVEQVIDAAVQAGANNIFGFNLGIADQATLASEARAQAIENANAKASELADLIGAELGSVVIISEMDNNNLPPINFQTVSPGLGGGAGGAEVETGQLSVNVHLQVTYQIIHTA